MIYVKLQYHITKMKSAHLTNTHIDILEIYLKVNNNKTGFSFSLLGLRFTLHIKFDPTNFQVVHFFGQRSSLLFCFYCLHEYNVWWPLHCFHECDIMEQYLGCLVHHEGEWTLVNKIHNLSHYLQILQDHKEVKFYCFSFITNLLLSMFFITSLLLFMCFSLYTRLIELGFMFYVETLDNLGFFF